MDGTGEHYAKWNKPGSEGQIPYDLTFNWNIIHKRKKQKNITIDIEIKNIVTIATGEWGEESGERGLRSFIGHKDKIKGEGRGGGGRWDWLGWGGGKGRKCRQL